MSRQGRRGSERLNNPLLFGCFTFAPSPCILTRCACCMVFICFHRFLPLSAGLLEENSNSYSSGSGATGEILISPAFTACACMGAAEEAQKLGGVGLCGDVMDTVLVQSCTVKTHRTYAEHRAQVLCGNRHTRTRGSDERPEIVARRKSLSRWSERAYTWP